MGLKEKLIAIEELSGRKSTVTITTDGELHGGAEICVENCRCIQELDDNFIVLSVYGMNIRVSGTPLTLENFGVGSVRITGNIHSLDFEENN